MSAAVVLAETSHEVADAVRALPLPAGDPTARWNPITGTVAWIASRKSRQTRRAYFGDLAHYLGWCQQTGLDPLDALPADIDTYVAETLDDLAASSTARTLTSLSSWYRYLIRNRVTAYNPVSDVERPKVDSHTSNTAALSAPEVTRFMRAARARTGRTALRDAAALGMLAELGLRVGEATALDVDSFSRSSGHRTVMVIGKGNRPRKLPVPAPLGRDLDAYWERRAAVAGVEVADLTGPAFVTRSGNRLAESAIFMLVREVAELAGIEQAQKLSPHSLRHTVATVALDAGAPLRDVQDLLGHADPRTTRRYDRSRGSLDRSPAYLIAGLFAHDDRKEAGNAPIGGDSPG